jgi:hypothetical protein
MATTEHKDRKKLTERKLISFFIAAAMAIGCWSAKSESTNESLTFFIVSEQKVDGGRFVNTTNFPHVGYIAAKPDMTVTNLANVFRSKGAEHSVVSDGKGKHTVIPKKPRLTLTVKLTAEDAKRFTALTESALGQKLLIMFSEAPLYAPRVMAPIQTPYFAIDFASDAELERIEKTLKKLVR